jgi:squalene cyclase
MLDVATVVDPALNHDDEAWGHDRDNRQSPHGDSIRNLTPPEERDQSRDRDDRDLHDIIYESDACGRIKNRRQEREHLE